MVQVPSTMLELGTEVPDFALPEPATGRTVTLADFADAPALLVVFLSNHCPFVKHLADDFAGFAREYGARGLAVVAINANDVARYPADSGPSPSTPATTIARRKSPATPHAPTAIRGSCGEVGLRVSGA